VPPTNYIAENLGWSGELGIVKADFPDVNDFLRIVSSPEHLLEAVYYRPQLPMRLRMET